MWPAEIAGEKVRFTILNDASDTSTATKNAAALINEDKVDLIIGASVTPTSLASSRPAGSAQVPVISLAGGGAIVLPQDGPRKWAFKLSPTEQLQSGLVLDHLLKHAKGKTMATIGFANSYGEGFLKAFEPVAQAKGVKIVASERYNPTDQSVTAQVLKLIAANPDAVYIFAAGTPGRAAADRAGAARLQGARLPDPGRRQQRLPARRRQGPRGRLHDGGAGAGPEQLPESNPIKKARVDYVQRFEAEVGAELALAVRRHRVGRAADRAAGGARGAEEEQAGNAGISRRAARRDRGPARFRRRRRRLQHEPRATTTASTRAAR